MLGVPTGGVPRPTDEAPQAAAGGVALIRFICFSFFKKSEVSYAVMGARNAATRAAPSELHGYAVTHLAHTHACTHAHAPACPPACTHMRDGVTA